MKDNNGNIMMEGVRLAFRNFQGLETQYTPKGSRDFCVVLPEEIVEPLVEDNWNVKRFRIREPGDIPEAYLKVRAHYGEKAKPKVVLITSRGRTELPEDYVGMLDWADIKFVDLIIRPYHWNIRGESGVSAYLKTMFVHIQEDALEEKYRDVPELGKDDRDYIEGVLVYEDEALKEIEV